MSAAEIRRAAAKVRELAEAASECGSAAGCADRAHSWYHVSELRERFSDARRGSDDAAYIAAMQPGVTLALADWLDDLHGRITDTDYDEDDELSAALRGNADITDWPEVHRALAVARQILGEA